MVTSAYFDYFLAMAGAVAALTGLLFVAISIQQERTFGPGAPLERRAVAATAFTALIAAFFISTEALLPETNVGFGCVVLAGLGLVTTLRLGAELVAYQFQPRERSRPLWLRLARALVLLLTSLLIYTYLFLVGRQLLAHPRDTTALGGVAVLLQVLCGLGLFRAWELLGASRQGFLSWLNPLLDLDEAPAPAAPTAPATTAPAPVAATSATPQPDGASAQG
ncbi:MAG TPA: hypothetical protein VGR57_16290 [Ktedonobacterales bacterium]|nr:hypothetical protein [Ktedonobacterales bacterium]